MVDLVIVLAVLIGALAGWRRGFIVPLLAQAGIVLSLATLYASPLSSALPSGYAGLGAGLLASILAGSILGAVGSFLTGLIYRFGALRRIDQAAGVPLGALIAAVTIYLALVGTLTLDAWLDPLHGKSAFGPQDIAAIQALAAANPTLSVFADPTALQTLAQAAARAPVNAEQLSQFDAALGFYERTLRPQLVQSRLAPVLLAVGEGLPVLGRHVEFPTR